MHSSEGELRLSRYPGFCETRPSACLQICNNSSAAERSLQATAVIFPILGFFLLMNLGDVGQSGRERRENCVMALNFFRQVMEQQG